MGIRIYKSPEGPSSGGASPCPSSLSWYPSGMPTGIFTLILPPLFSRPFPLQFLHGESMVWPLPLQAEHDTICTNVPKPLLLLFWSFPDPLHFGQVCTEAPGAAPEPPQTSHLSILWISISFSTPLAASSRVMLTSQRNSRPRITSCLSSKSRPPKKTLKRSPKPELTPMSRNIESKSAPRKMSSRLYL